MIWATVSSRSCPYWLYRAFPFCCKEHNQPDFGIDHLLIFMYKVISGVVGKGCLLWPLCSLGKILGLHPASFCTPRSNLPVILDISLPSTFPFQSPMMKMTFFLMLVLEELINFSFFSISGLSRLGLLWGWVVFLGNRDLSVVFRSYTSTALQTLLLTMRTTPFPLRDSLLH